MQSKVLTLRIDDQDILDSIEFLKARYNEKASSKAIFKHLNNAKRFKKQAEDLSDAYELLYERYEILVDALRDRKEAQDKIDCILEG